jgi:hypothetical protein
MTNDWIIDVLADLTTYAEKNGLSALSRQLDDTKLIAATELASLDGKALDAAGFGIGKTGNYYSKSSVRQNA